LRERPGAAKLDHVHLDVRGHPLHTRALAVTLTQRADARLDAHAYVLDVRKRGFVPVAADLQGSGIIHHMTIEAVVDPTSATLERVSAAQPSVAFEPSAVTAGESCRDPVARIEALAGSRLDADYGHRLAAAIGGPRGCSHVLTLGHLLGASIAWALARDRDLHGLTPIRPAGQRVFRRDIVVDGHERTNGRLELAAQLTELHLAPAPALAMPMDRFARELEIRALAEVDLSSFTLSALRVAERQRGPADLATAPWQTRSATTAWLEGQRLGAGITAELLRRFGAEPGDRPLLDVLLMLAPALIQCSAALSDAWPLAAQANPSLIGMQGLPDSCYMWRRDGALLRARTTGQEPR
jgi:hypothetical protein